MKQQVLLVLSISMAVLSAISVDAQYDYKVTRDELSKFKTITLEPKSGLNHTSTLIFFHGLGGSAEEQLKYFANQPENRITPLNMKIILPTAPKKKLAFCKVPFMEKKATVTEANILSRIDQTDLEFSADYMLSLIEKEAELLKGETKKIFIGGFSEGATVSLAAFLKYKGEKPLGGVIGLSGFQGLDYNTSIHFKNHEERQRIQDQRKVTPMFLYHGRDDKQIPFHGAIITYDYLRNIVYRGSHKLEFYVEDNMDHDEDSEEQWRQLGEFIHSLTWNNRKVDKEELNKVKKLLPELDEAISKVQKHQETRAIRKQGAVPQVEDQQAFYHRAQGHHQHHHHLHQKSHSY